MSNQKKLQKLRNKYCGKKTSKARAGQDIPLNDVKKMLQLAGFSVQRSNQDETHWIARHPDLSDMQSNPTGLIVIVEKSTSSSRPLTNGHYLGRACKALYFLDYHGYLS